MLEKRTSQFKKSQTAVSTTERYFTLSVVCLIVVVVVAVVVIGQTVGSISSRTLAYDCLCTLELCTASMIANR